MSDITIMNAYCPKCEKECWVNLGDESDCTIQDIDAIKCPYCNHTWFVIDEIEQEMLDCTPDESSWEQGYKTPNETIGL